ncbi:MAG: acetyl-CoA carboxylase biotin carboxyl carrier protein [Proteobacteria bacterium]|nr:acetyl-CoA carboxylase biotin carboxyl carrier protein [Pseudomonadota bacterium]
MDLERIEALLTLLAEHDVSEFKYKDDSHSLQLRLGAVPVAPVMAAAPMAPMAAAAAGAPAAAAAGGEAGLPAIESPMVGTFYRAPTPDAAPFVKVGDTVSAGSVVCIVEAMKLMNEIEAEVSGTIVEVLVENAQPVQFGQPLFTIQPN